jgi:hypothetical protein
VKPSSTKEATPINKQDNDWGNDDNDWGESASDDDDWGIGSKSKSNTNEVSIDDLEAMISKCEMQSTNVSAQPKSGKAKTDSNDNTKPNNVIEENVPSFQRFNLEMFDEPPYLNSKNDNSNIDDQDGDEEDDYVNSNNIDSSKVNQMLSRYLETEEDEEILSALRGGSLSKEKAISGKGGGGGERYERLPPEERAFLAFSKRLKRAPLQVVRYAYNGVPLWSM